MWEQCKYTSLRDVSRKKRENVTSQQCLEQMATNDHFGHLCSQVPRPTLRRKSVGESDYHLWHFGYQALSDKNCAHGVSLKRTVKIQFSRANQTTVTCCYTLLIFSLEISPLKFSFVLNFVKSCCLILRLTNGRISVSILLSLEFLLLRLFLVARLLGASSSGEIVFGGKTSSIIPPFHCLFQLS